MNRLIFFLLAGLLLAGCSSEPKLDSSSAEGGYKLGERYEKNERFEDAIAQYNIVRNKHPYSNFATESELRIADIYFKREDFAEAQATYQTFKEMHPSHGQSDFVTFRLAESFYRQLPPTIDRDLSLADKALLYLDEVMTSYPKSAYVAQSAELKRKIRLMLAEKELYIAYFYFVRKKYDSALGRYESLLQKYPGLGLEPKALYGAAVSAKRMKDSAKAETYLNRLVTDYKDTKEAKDAKGALAHGN